MAVLFPDAFGTFLQFQQALDALRASSWLEPSISGGGAFPPLNVFRKGDDIVILTYRDGVLALYLPRAERDKPKAITVA